LSKVFISKELKTKIRFLKYNALSTSEANNNSNSKYNKKIS
jgi:hypothetical protein